MSDEIGTQDTKILDSLDGAIDQMIANGATPKLIRLTPADWKRLDDLMSAMNDDTRYVFRYRDIIITSGEVSQVESN